MYDQNMYFWGCLLRFVFGQRINGLELSCAGRMPMPRHHTAMAAFSSGLHAPADGGGGGVDVTLELSALREMDKWEAMVSWVELHLATAARRALSYHLPTECETRLDTEHRTLADGGG